MRAYKRANNMWINGHKEYFYHYYAYTRIQKMSTKARHSDNMQKTKDDYPT